MDTEEIISTVNARAHKIAHENENSFQAALHITRPFTRRQIPSWEALIYSMNNKSVLLYCKPSRSNSKSYYEMVKGNDD